MVVRTAFLSLVTGLTFGYSAAARAGVCLGSVSCWSLSCNNDVECTSTGICNACSSGEALRHDADAQLSPRRPLDLRDFARWLDSSPRESAPPSAPAATSPQPS